MRERNANADAVAAMLPDFNFPSRGAQLWTAMRFVPADVVDRNNNYLQAIGRLRRDVSLDAARTEMSVLAGRLQQQYPRENDEIGASVIRLRDGVSPQSRTLLVTLFAAAACVLLIACANLTNLLLARAIGRRREMAVRMALGGRPRTSAAAAADREPCGHLDRGCARSRGGRSDPADPLSPRAHRVADRRNAYDGPARRGVRDGPDDGDRCRVRHLPLLQHHRDRASEGLREGARSGGSGRERMRSALVVAEITASVVLLVMCGLLLRALSTIQAIDPGFTLERTLTARTSLPMPRYETVGARTGFCDGVLSDIRALPGVSSAAYTSFLPLSDMRGGIFPVGIGGRVDSRRQDNVAFLRYVTPGFFQTLGIPILQGRDVRDADHLDGPPVAIVSASFVTRFLPGHSAQHESIRRP